jgi:type I restriction enzyme R subunit
MSETETGNVESPNEDGVMESFLRWFDELSWETYGRGDGEGAQVLDERYDRDRNEVVYWEILREKLVELNEAVDESNVSGLVSSLRRDLSTDNLMNANQAFHEILQKGKKYTATREDGTTETRYARLIDFENIENNRFVVANEFRVRDLDSIRPDINLFVNGIPLVTGELKGLTQDNNYQNAISDLREYEQKAPRLFVPGLMNFAADTLEFRRGAVGAPAGFYEPWRDAPEEYQHENDQRQTVQALFNHETLLNILQNYVFFEEQAGGDAKIIPRHPQYYAAEEILSRIDEGRHDSGLIWHTQGSGKSYTMLYAARNLMESAILHTPQVVVVVDTDKLRSQMSNTLAKIGFTNYEVAESMDHLQGLLESGTGSLVLTTIQMFADVDDDVQGNEETVVMSDEAHRFLEKDLGTRLEAALPRAYHFGFTGTPVRESERDTFENFCPVIEDAEQEEERTREEYLHRYSIQDGIEDELILPVHFDIRNIMEWDIDEDALDRDFEQSFSEMPIDRKQEVLREYVTQTEIAELRSRVETIVDDIDSHFTENIEPNGWKGMVVTPSRRAAALYGEELSKYRNPEEVEVLITAGGDDESLLQQFHTTKEERERVVQEFKDEENPKLLVVCDMLLTGFDAPVLKTMYLDRGLKNHNLLQAVARTNRPAEGKENGLIVDYAGVFEDIDDALEYDDEIQGNAARDVDALLDKLETVLDELFDLFDDVPKLNSQEAVAEAVARASDNAREFEQGFGRAQDLYETISPDGRLAARGLLERYKWLSKIHVAYRRSKRDDDPEEGLREKTKEMMEKHVDVDEIHDNYPIYEISQEHLEKIDDLEPSAQAAEVAHATQDHLQPRRDMNPRYERLSDRVKDILGKLADNEMPEPEAVEKLRAVERETIQIKQEVAESDTSPAEYALYTLLKDTYADYIGGDEEAQDIASDVVERFEESVQTDYDGWATNEETKRDIKKVVMRVIIKEYGNKELYNQGFADDARKYLIENYA